MCQTVYLVMIKKNNNRDKCNLPSHLSLAIIVYRLPWTWKCSKLLMKSIHAGLNTVAAILAVISLVAVFDFHNTLNIPNMYSLHSWIGLIAVILYILQVGVSISLYTRREKQFRFRRRFLCFTSLLKSSS